MRFNAQIESALRWQDTLMSKIDCCPSWQQWSYTGILIMFLGTTVISLGLLLQKQAHNQQNNSKAGASKPYYAHGAWGIAIATYISGHLLCWIGLGMAPQIILSMLNSWTMASTVLLAHFFLGEHMTFRQGTCTGFLALCIVILVYTGPRINERETLGSLRAHLYNPRFLHVGLLLSLVLVVVFAGSNTILHSLSSSRRDALFYIFAAGACAWVSSIMSKCTASLTVTAWIQGEEDSLLRHVEYWLLHGFMLFFGLSNIHFINKALQKDNATFIVPLYEVTSIVGQVILGGVFFEEFAEMSNYHLCWFFGLLPLVLLGICAMAFETRAPRDSAEVGAG